MSQLPTSLEAMRAIKAGTVTPPPIAELIGLELDRVDPGEVVFAIEPRADLGNGMGMLHGGLIATIMDFACSVAVATELPAGNLMTTIELKISYLRPAPVDGGRIEATGRALRVGRGVGFADALARDESGELVAQATSSLAIRKLKG